MITQLNKNPSGLPIVSRLDTGAEVSDQFQIVEKFEFDIITDPLISDYLYYFRHNLGKTLDFFGRYKKSTQTKWTTIQNITRVTSSLQGGVALNRITNDDIVFYVDFASDFPIINFEIYFIDDSIE